MPEVTKRKVTMTNWSVTQDENGAPVPVKIEAVDYVRPDFLEAYVVDAKTRWSVVEVSEEPDAGPAGYHGQTVVPRGLNHELAGRVFEATNEEDDNE